MPACRGGNLWLHATCASVPPASLDYRLPRPPRPRATAAADPAPECLTLPELQPNPSTQACAWAASLGLQDWGPALQGGREARGPGMQAGRRRAGRAGRAPASPAPPAPLLTHGLRAAHWPAPGTYHCPPGSRSHPCRQGLGRAHGCAGGACMCGAALSSASAGSECRGGRGHLTQGTTLRATTSAMRNLQVTPPTAMVSRTG